jgi:hypothetical protein
VNADEWPDEPDEPDPESRWGNPEEDLVSIPSVGADEEPTDEAAGAGIEADGEVARFFWVSVVYANVALGGICVGLLLVGFRGQWTLGGGAVAVGLLALYRTYDLYRTYRAEVADPDGVASDGSGANAAASARGDGAVAPAGDTDSHAAAVAHGSDEGDDSDR